MSNKFSCLALLIAIVALIVAFVRPVGHENVTAKHELAFERIMRTKTLRCGYGIWAPGLMKDPNTGKLSGIFYDYMEAVGKHTGLKIDWTGEVGWGDFPTALNDGRIDAMCAGMWPKAMVAKEIMFSEPIYYLPINAYVRADDNRFDYAQEKINAPGVIISVMDSEMSSQLAAAYFSQAKTFSVSQLSDPSMLLLNVSSGKADITFTDAWTGADFMKQNDGKLKVVPFDRPLQLFGNTVAIAQGENTLWTFLNTAKNEISNSGELETIVKRYETISGVLLHLPRPYENPEGKKQ